MTTSREYEGLIIKKELTKHHNYRLLIRLENDKIIFCYTKRFISTAKIQEQKEYYFSDSQKNGGKYYFLDHIEPKENQQIENNFS